MIVGVDFGAPQWARDQRRKIVAIAACATGPRAYRIDGSGMNARLLAHGPPGWSAYELTEHLLTHPARVVGFDFPFGIPDALLSDSAFASAAGYAHGAFGNGQTFRTFVAESLPLRDPLDFEPFAAWRAPEHRARLWTKRDTDVAAGAQPPLKDKFQSTFQMTLLGNAVLARMWGSNNYRVPPFPGGKGDGEAIEVYPRATLRHMGLPSYKGRPDDAVRAAIAACALAGVSLEVDPRIRALCTRYSSGTPAQPDFDAADAFVALCTSILYAEGACRPARVVGDIPRHSREGAIWVPTIPSTSPREHAFSSR